MRSGRWLLLAGVVPLVCCGSCVGLALNWAGLDPGDTKTEITTSEGWRYRVSDAKIKTSGQLRGIEPAAPGKKYLYFDIMVGNLVNDREAPGIEFNFALPVQTIGPDCGDSFLGRYRGGIVDGYCIENTQALFLGSGTACYDADDRLIRKVDRLRAGGKNEVRCVFGELVNDSFDLERIKVFYVGDGKLGDNSRLTYPHLKEIPTRT